MATGGGGVSQFLANQFSAGTPEQTRQAAIALAEKLEREAPKVAFKAIARAMAKHIGRFKSDFRATMPSKFRATGGQPVGNSFKSYVAGESLDSLRAAVFTRWEAAPIYESGGTITPRNRKWLVIPVSPDAYGADGRVKPKWRQLQYTVFGDLRGGRKAGFATERFDGLAPIKVRGGWLLVEPRKTARNREGKRVKSVRGRMVGKPIFLLVKATNRKPILNFLNDARRMVSTFGDTASRFLAEHLEQLSTGEAVLK